MTHTEPIRVIIRWRTADPKAIEAIRKKFNLPSYTMALTLNKKILPDIISKAHASGLITAESSSTVAVYQISRYWRELFQRATRHRSDALPAWSEKEHAAAKVITSALLFLAMEECRDVESLLCDTVGIPETGSRQPTDSIVRDSLLLDALDRPPGSSKIEEMRAEMKRLKADLKKANRKADALQREVLRLLRGKRYGDLEHPPPYHQKRLKFRDFPRR